MSEEEEGYQRGQEWWTSPFKNHHPKISIETCAIEDLTELPGGAQREISQEMEKRRNMTDSERAAYDKKVAKEREEEAMKRDAQRQIEAEVTRRKTNNAKAMNDPQKAAMLEMMKKNFPDIPIEFR